VVDTPPVGPQINDGYWFAYSKSIVDGAVRARDDAADKLQAFVGWLWVIYTAGTAVGINLGKLALAPGLSLLLASPIIFLMVAYWLTVWTRTPDLVQFDPRVPQEIESVYQHDVLAKQRRLILALACAGLSGLLVATSILVASTVKSVATPALSGTVIHHDSGTYLEVSGTTGSGTHGTVSVHVYNEKIVGTLLWQQNCDLVGGELRSVSIKLPDPAPHSVLIELSSEDGTANARIAVSKVLDVPAAKAT
jgi:hypothetical protein